MVGRTLAHYTILEKLGEGGMGVVYKARDAHLDRFVALKLLPVEKLADPERRRRFVQEAKAASALNHPSIVTIHDISSDGGQDFIAMEYVEGKTLDQLSGRDGMPVKAALKYAVQVAGALARAHSAGIIHRDLKPSNIMSDEHGQVKVLDFGLAKLTQPTESPDEEVTRSLKPTTEEGMVVGTVEYMSPEQAQALKVDARTDIFSFGVVLYEMLSGRRPFRGKTRLETLSAILSREPESLDARIPPDLQKVVTRCLRKERERRYQHMDDVLVALQELKEESDSGKLPGAVPARRPVWRSWVWLAAIAVAALTAVAGVIALLPPPAPPQLEWRRLTNDSSVKAGPVLSDGARLYFRTSAGGDCVTCAMRLQILQVPVSGGEPAALPVVPPPGFIYDVLDITPNGQELLVSARDPQSDGGALWALRIADGASRRIGSSLATCARYSPDGKQIAFSSNGNHSLWVAPSDGSAPRRLIEVKPRFVNNPFWSADGKQIVFGQLNADTGEGPVWEVMVDGTGLRRLFPDWAATQTPAGWTPDGRLFLVSRGQFWTVQERRFFGRGRSSRIQLSSGEPQFSGLLHPRDSRTFYDVGTTPLGQLQRFDARSRTWTPHLGGISADSVEYSSDGQSVLYITYPDRELWVRRADGSQRVQLTNAPMQATIGRWSPDGRVIAFTSQSAPDRPQRVYLVNAGGGNVRLASAKGCNGPDLAWMPDGKKIVCDWSRSSDEPYTLGLLDLATGDVTQFPGSERHFHSPRVSPDGSTLAALRFESANHLMLYRFSAGVWQKIEHRGMADWITWSHDGRSIWYYDQTSSAIVRYHVRENRREEMLALKGEEMTGRIGFWIALTPNDEPMTLRRRDVQQIYALTWKER